MIKTDFDVGYYLGLIFAGAISFLLHWLGSDWTEAIAMSMIFGFLGFVFCLYKIWRDHAAN